MTVASDNASNLGARRVISEVDCQTAGNKSHETFDGSAFLYSFVSPGDRYTLTTRDEDVLSRDEETQQSGGRNEY